MGLENPIHLAFLLLLVLLVFGAKRLPELGRSLGAGMRGFKDTISGESALTAIDPVPERERAAMPLATPAPVVSAATESHTP